MRPQVGVGGARGLDPQLPLQVLVELAVDGGDADADADVAGRGRRDLERLADIARRLGVRDVRRDDRQAGCVAFNPDRAD